LVENSRHQRPCSLKVLPLVLNGKLDVRFLKIAIKAMSDPKKVSPLARKVLEVPTSLEINFSTIGVGLHCSFDPEKTSLYHSLMSEIYSTRSR